MATDEFIKERLLGLLGQSDLQTTTEKMLRKKLEEELGEDLSAKKSLIRSEIEAFLDNQKSEGGEEDGEVEEEEEEEGGGGRKRSGGGGGGFGRACVLSPELQEFLGEAQMSRSQVVKKIWEYIKANDLQDPKNKRNIIVDEKLATIFTPPINMFSMNKQLSRHCKAAHEVARGSGDEGEGRPKPPRARAKPAAAGKKRAAAGGGGGGGGAKKPRGMYGEVRLSDALAAVTGRATMTRSDLTKWAWAYFREHGLQDPADKSMIVCDTALKSLFGVDRFKGFGVQKYLKDHVLGPAGGGPSPGDDDAGDAGDADGAGDEEEEEEEGAEVEAEVKTEVKAEVKPEVKAEVKVEAPAEPAAVAAAADA